MKKIEAIIKPYKLAEIISALEKIGIKKVIAEEVKGYGKSLNPASLYKTKKGMNFSFEYLPKIKIYIVVEDHILEQTINTIIHITSNKEIGDGKIFITNVEDCIDIHSGERGFCGNPL